MDTVIREVVKFFRSRKVPQTGVALASASKIIKSLWMLGN
jgi:hypothetical protein